MFRKILLAAVFVAAAFGGQQAWGQGVDSVRGYTRSNGTSVAPYHRTHRDNIFSNNWSTKGNVNPYTGQPGTRVTPPRSYSGPSYPSYSPSYSPRSTYPSSGSRYRIPSWPR
jgi:hypothetical protein